MVHLKYKDFTELYYNLSRFPLTDQKSEDFFEIGGSLYVNDLIIETTSHDLVGPASDLGNFNYSTNKWTILLNKYIDPKAYSDLKIRLVESTCKTVSFNFKIHIAMPTDKDHTKSRDSCIIAMVFSRNGTKGKWTRVSVYWRAQEIYQKGAADWILLNRMFEDLPNLDLKNYLFHMSQPFWSSFKLCELINSPLFSIDEFKDSQSFIGRKLYADYVRYYGHDAKLSNYHAIRRKQEMRINGVVNKSVPIESLKIYPDYIDNKVSDVTKSEIVPEELW